MAKKITKKQLARVIKEEVQRALKEDADEVTGNPGAPDPDDIVGTLQQSLANLRNRTLRKGAGEDISKKIERDKPLSDDERALANKLIAKDPEKNKEMRLYLSQPAGEKRSRNIDSLQRLVLDLEIADTPEATDGGIEAIEMAKAVSDAAMAMAEKYENDQRDQRAREEARKIKNQQAAFDFEFEQGQIDAAAQRKIATLQMQLERMFEQYDRTLLNIIDRFNGPGVGAPETQRKAKGGDEEALGIVRKAREIVEKAFLPKFTDLLSKLAEIGNRKSGIPPRQLDESKSNNRLILENHRRGRGVHPAVHGEWWYGDK